MLKTINTPKKNPLANLYYQLFLPATKGINFDIAAAIALESSQNIEISNRGDLKKIYQDGADLIQPLVAEVSGLTTGSKSKIIVLDRDEWIINTIYSISSLFNDITKIIWELLEKNRATTFTKKTTEIISTAELGLLLGFLSQKVLGQYDINFLSDGVQDQLFIIEPNIAWREKKLDLEDAPLRLWILAHELTHKLQFSHFKWIKKYYLSLIDELKKTITSELETKNNTRLPTLSLLTNKKNWQLVNKIQSFMSLIEGYADFVMFNVGKKLGHYHKLHAVFSERHQNENVLRKMIEKAIGLDIKVKQYRQGLSFVSHIDKTKSIEYLNDKMIDVNNIPTLTELSEPTMWLKRVSG